MQLERIKSVGKKKVVIIGTALMLTVGGIGASASGTVQDSVKTAMDNFFAKAVTYYVQEVDTQLTAYAEQKKGTIPGGVANAVVSYTSGLKAHYENELTRAKKEIDKHTQDGIQAQYDYGNQKYYESTTAITNKVNSEVAEKKAEIDALIATEYSKFE